MTNNRREFPVVIVSYVKLLKTSLYSYENITHFIFKFTYQFETQGY